MKLRWIPTSDKRTRLCLNLVVTVSILKWNFFIHGINRRKSSRSCALSMWSKRIGWRWEIVRVLPGWSCVEATDQLKYHRSMYEEEKSTRKVPACEEISRRSNTLTECRLLSFFLCSDLWRPRTVNSMSFVFDLSSLKSSPSSEEGQSINRVKIYIRGSISTTDHHWQKERSDTFVFLEVHCV